MRPSGVLFDDHIRERDEERDRSNLQSQGLLAYRKGRAGQGRVNDVPFA